MPAPTLANSKCQAAYKPNGVISTRPHRLMMALMRLGLSTAVNFLPITAYDASQTTAANTSRLPSQACCAAPLSSPDATLCLASDNKPIPSAPQATASHTRTPMRSRRKIQLNKATTAGITDMMTPADTALVMLTPVIMQIENRKLLVFLESFLGNFLFSICMITGVSMTSAVSAGVIMSVIPAVVALLSWIFLRERIGLRGWLAVACGALGSGLLSLAKSSHAPGLDSAGAAAHQAWLGNLLIFAAVLCEASYAVIGKKLTAVLSPKRISSVINLWGLILMTPMGFYTALHFDFGGVHKGIWLLLLFYALAASVWSVWLWMTGLKSIPASRAGVFTVMLPVSTALVGVLALGETLTMIQLAAFAVALIGMLLVTVPGKSTVDAAGAAH